MKALIHVTLKPDVLDPQGKAIQNASAALGYDAVKSVRQGKLDTVGLPIVCASMRSVNLMNG